MDSQPCSMANGHHSLVFVGNELAKPRITLVDFIFTFYLEERFSSCVPLTSAARLILRFIFSASYVARLALGLTHNSPKYLE